MIKPWELKFILEKYKSIPFDVIEKTYLRPDTGKDFTASILTMPDWVNIIATNSNNEILLIKQFRFGTDRIELEIPGGCLNPGENPEIGAARELKEETGFISDNFVELGIVHTNPAIQTNKCYTFLAENIRDTGILNLDPDEIIEYKFASIEKVKQYINNKKITNAYIVAAFYWFFNNK